MLARMEHADTHRDPHLPPIPSALLLDILKDLMADNPRHVASSAMLVSKEWRGAAMTPELWEHVEVTLTDESHSLPCYAHKVTLPHVDAVTALSRSFERLDDAGLRTLQLRELTLTGNAQPSVSDLHALRKVPNLTKLVCDRSNQQELLYRASKGFAERFKQALSLCTQLRHLQVDLPMGLSHLTSLTGLRVLNMQQQFICSVTHHVAALTGLQELYLLAESLGSEGQHSSALLPIANLRVLHVCCTEQVQEQSLMEVVTKFTQLQRLSIPVFEKFTHTALHSLASLTQLQRLSLQCRNMFPRQQGFPAEWLAAVSVLARQCTNLKHLSFREYPLPVGAVANFGTLTNLESLDVAGTDRLGAADAMVLAGLTKLTTLHLTGSALGITALHALNSLRNLRELVMWGNMIDADVRNGEEDNRRHYGIMLQLTGLSQLEQLQLHWNPAIETPEMKRPSTVNSCPTTCIRELTSSGMMVDSERSVLHTRLLAHFSKVETLAIAAIGTCGESVSILSALANLTQLDLTSCRQFIDPCFDASHFSTLSALTRLTSLRLRGHNLGPKAAPEIAKIGSLHKLDLGACGVGGLDGSAPELHMLSSLVGLKDLDLSRNKLTNAACPQLARLTGLTRLDISRNPIDYDGVKQLTVLNRLRFLRTDRRAQFESGEYRGADLFPVLERRRALLRVW